LFEWAVLREFPGASEETYILTKTAVTEMVIANLDYFGRNRGVPRLNSFKDIRFSFAQFFQANQFQLNQLRKKVSTPTLS